MDPSADPEDQHRQDGLIISSVVLTVVAGIFVVLRCISRFILLRNPGPDDFFMIGAMVLTIGYLVDLFVLRQNGIGFPMTMLTPDNMVNFIKVTLAVQVMYYTIVFCIKTSILLTYLRFAISGTFRVLCYGTIALHSVFFFICLVVTLSQCRPLHKMWDLRRTEEGSCINTTAFFYSTSSFNIITDIWILVIPFKTLRSIQRPQREKVALFLIFGVGAFAAAASIVRLHTIRIYTQAEDPFREGIQINLWSMIEVNIAIACASVPALKPVFSKRQRRASRAAKSMSGTSGTESGNRPPLRYQHSQTRGPRMHSHIAAHESLVDESGSVAEVLKKSRSADQKPERPRPWEEKGHDSSDSSSLGFWAVPPNLLRPPPQARRPAHNGTALSGDSADMTFLRSDSEGQVLGNGKGKAGNGPD